MTPERRILVTNDDGIDSAGLHELARAMRRFGDVTVVAPDSEYSGAGASIGAIWERMPDVHEASVEGIDTAWSVSGPPALCVLLSRMGAFGPLPDLVVSGINPGANVGRSVYHSGTIGAALTARNGSIPGVAVSQLVTNNQVEGQAWGDVIDTLPWQTAVAVAVEAVAGLLEAPRAEPGVLNINVPDLPLDEIEGWKWTTVGLGAPGGSANVELTPKPNQPGSYEVTYSYSGAPDPDPVTDIGVVRSRQVSLTWLSRITAEDPASPAIDAALNTLLNP